MMPPSVSPHSLAPGDITLGLLAGGRASRLGGVEKAWLERDGMPQALRWSRRFAGEHGPVLVSANRGFERYARYGLLAVPDRLYANSPQPRANRGAQAGAETGPNIGANFDRSIDTSIDINIDVDIDSDIDANNAANNAANIVRSAAPDIAPDIGPDIDRELDRSIGPLAGLEALAHACETPWLFTLPVDLVGANDCLLRTLIAARGADGAYAQDDDGPQSLVALWRRDALRAACDAALRAGERAVHRLAQRLDLAQVPFAGLRFGNLNTPDDLRAAGIALPEATPR